ncbi:hypothetical protein FOCC_FOCC014017 [Frankliniella occidentalis]|nr:hypothetical protein FOCC_FOCC014017 [Frankliniella occidentalis]
MLLSSKIDQLAIDSDPEVLEKDDDPDLDPEIVAVAKEAGVEMLMGEICPSDADLTRLMINLDRAKISTSAAFRAIASLCLVANIDVTTLRFSRSGIYRRRNAVRESEADAIREGFNPDGPLTVHMDGKKMPPLSGKGAVEERQPVLVTRKGVSQLLSSNILLGGTGRDIATEVLRQLESFNISEEVKHHALEIIPKHLFQELMERSSSPDIGKLCKNFGSEWSNIDKSKFTPATMANDPKEQVRADYQYFLQLALIFIGETPPKNIYKYSDISEKVSNIAKKAFLNHLWYLSPHCVALAFFDRDVPIEVKIQMVQNLANKAKDKVPPKQLKWPKKLSMLSNDLTVATFVNCHTKEFFRDMNRLFRRERGEDSTEAQKGSLLAERRPPPLREDGYEKYQK